jgi:predicted DNA-binding protein
MAEEELVQKNIRFPVSLWERLEKLTTTGKRSDFIREAVEEKLKPLELEARLKALEEKVADGS